MAIKYDNAKILLDGPICIIGKSIKNAIRVIATRKGKNISQLLLPKNFID